jgi:uncharacterized protein (TIGR02147 family)
MKPPSNIFSFSDPREWLAGVMTARKVEDPKFSLRSFSRELGYQNPSLLSEVIRGTRSFRQDLADRLGRVLGLDSREMQWLSLMLASRVAGSDPKDLQDIVAAAKGAGLQSNEKETMSLDQFRIIADWHHLAILEMIDLEEFKDDSFWISKKLGGKITPVQASLAIDRLFRLGLIKRVGRNKIAKTNREIFVGLSGIPNAALRAHHKGFLDLAKDAIDHTPLERRTGYGTNIAVRQSDLPRIKALVKKFHEDLHQFHVENNGEDVYHVNLQVFPLTESTTKPQIR